MLRPTVRPSLAILVSAVMTAAAVGAAAGGESPPGTHAGPPYDFRTEIMYDNVVPLKDMAIIGRTEHGYRFRAGQQNSHIVVSLGNGGLRFRDTGTKSFKNLSPKCTRMKVRVGIAAVCPLPKDISVRRPLLIEVWPRLGNDYLDTSTLPATFSTTMLGDRGLDAAHFGAGPDFFNGFTGRDRIRGGAGNDWIRSGLGSDFVWGGAGADDIVAVEGNDAVRGGRGNDRLWVGDGDDRVRAGAGTDFVVCGTGRDSATVSASDRILDCEAVDLG